MSIYFFPHWKKQRGTISPRNPNPVGNILDHNFLPSPCILFCNICIFVFLFLKKRMFLKVTIPLPLFRILLNEVFAELEDVIDDIKVIFYEDDVLRVLRGRFDGEDDFFVYIKRRDGKFTIGKKFIVKIERLNNE
jgi:hypothetical protein